jgi:hypothetical protein
MQNDDLLNQLKRLFIGMTDQEIRSGNEFLYDGGSLHADEVCDLLLPSVLCIAQDLSDRLGLGSFGYEFTLGPSEPTGFPLTMACGPSGKLFLEIAPFVAEVFKGEVMDCRTDPARLFECAAKLIDPAFSLDRDTNYSTLEP